MNRSVVTVLTCLFLLSVGRAPAELIARTRSRSLGAYHTDGQRLSMHTSMGHQSGTEFVKKFLILFVLCNMIPFFLAV